MTHAIKMQNLSSGDVVVFNNVFIQNYSFKKILNWDTTNTIGRMDPIKTFKNTESKIDTSFTVINPHVNITHHKFKDTGLSYDDPDNIDSFFDKPKTKQASVGVYSYDSNLNIISKLLYPSYEKASNSPAPYMQSAPILRVSIYKPINNEIVIFNGYATINALDTNFKAEDVSAPSGRSFSSLEFSILFDVIHVNESDIRSRQETKQITEEDVTKDYGTGMSMEVDMSYDLSLVGHTGDGSGGLLYRGSSPITIEELDEYRNEALQQTTSPKYRSAIDKLKQRSESLESE